MNNYVKQNKKQLTIDSNKITNNNIIRCSWQFCKYQDKWTYDYDSNSKNNVTYQDHYVHNMISTDIKILLYHYKQSCCWWQH